MVTCHLVTIRRAVWAPGPTMFKGHLKPSIVLLMSVILDWWYCIWKKVFKTDWTLSGDEERWCQQSQCLTSLISKPHYWLGLCAMPSLQHSNYFNDWVWKAGLVTFNKLPSTGVNQVLLAPYKWLIHDINFTKQQNRTT